MIYTKVQYHFNVTKEYKYPLIILLINSKGELIQTLKDEVELQPGYSGANRSLGYGFEDTGCWEVDCFKAKVFIDGMFYAEKDFEVTEERNDFGY